MQPCIFHLFKGVGHYQVANEGQVSQFNDGTTWKGGFPNQIHLLIQQCKTSLGSAQSLIGPDNAHLLRHGADQTGAIVDDGGVFSQAMQTIGPPCRVSPFVGCWWMINQVLGCPVSVNNGFEQAV